MLKAARDKYAVNAAPSMYLVQESIDTITDMATRLSIHEDVLRAYMGIDNCRRISISSWSCLRITR